MVHRVTSVHYQQVLIDREDAIGLKRFGDLGVNLKAGDWKLLLRILVLFHENHVLNGFVAHLESLVPRQDDFNHEAHELLQCTVEKHEYYAAYSVARLEYAKEAAQFFIIHNRNDTEQEEEVVAYWEDDDVAFDGPTAVDIDYREHDIIEDYVGLPW